MLLLHQLDREAMEIHEKAVSVMVKQGRLSVKGLLRYSMKKTILLLGVLVVFGVAIIWGWPKYDRYREQSMWHNGRLVVEGVITEVGQEGGGDGCLGCGSTPTFTIETDKGNIVLVKLASENLSLGPDLDKGSKLNQQILSGLGSGLNTGLRVRVIGGYVGDHLMLSNNPTDGDRVEPLR